MIINLKILEIKCGICDKEIDLLDPNKVPIEGAEEGKNYAYQECFNKLRDNYYRAKSEEA